MRLVPYQTTIFSMQVYSNKSYIFIYQTTNGYDYKCPLRNVVLSKMK